VGDFVADLLVEGQIIVELKAVRELDATHVAQGINYLKATGLPTSLLINFGTPKIQIRRLMMDRASGQFSNVLEEGSGGTLSPGVPKETEFFASDGQR